MTCSDCDRPHYAKGLCKSHYAKRRRACCDTPCQVAGCAHGGYIKGLCNAHYLRSKKGDLKSEVPIRQRGGTCAHTGCEAPHYSRGYCRLHYVRDRRGIALDKPLPVQQEHCDVADCQRVHYSGGWCNFHWQRKRAGKPFSDPPMAYPIGGTRATTAGYRELKTTSGWSLQHRVVMESAIGRALHPDETVHHINGVKDDNRLENLELWASHHPPGQRVEDLLAWADEIEARYR